MNPDPDPRADAPTPAVTAALRQGNKIEAIKLLRDAEHLGLKQAKERVDDYLRRDPALRAALQDNRGVGAGQALRWIVVLLIIGALGYYLSAH